MTSQRIGQSRNPELSEVLEALKANIFGSLYVGMPGKVTKYITSTQLVNVKPLLKRALIGDDGTEIQEDIPEITNVPVIFPRGGDFFLHFPLAPGDNVLLLFMDKSIDTYIGSAGNVDLDQVDLRAHDLSDAVAIPGFYPITKPIIGAGATDLLIGKKAGPTITIKPTQVDINGNFTVDL